MNYFHVFCLNFLLLVINSEASSLPEIVKLKLNSGKTQILNNAYEISGLSKVAGQWVTVLDDEHEHFVYKIVPIKGASVSELVPLYNLKDLKGYQAYQRLIIAEKMKRGPKYNLWDLEGLATCSDSFYLVNERFRHVLKIDVIKKSIANLSPKLIKSLTKDKYKKYSDLLFEGGANAGFEGIAVDCEKKVIYLSKERSPRFIITYSLIKQEIIDIFNLPNSSENRKGFEKNPKEGEVNEDFADLVFYQDHLYALERNNFVILKINPSLKKVVNRFSFAGPNFSYIHFAKSKEPYGMAEALYIENNSLFIGFDTNQNHLNHKAEKLGNLPEKNANLNLILNFNLP